MASLPADLALMEALRRGWALLKFISANDAGVTGSHQRGFYLPKECWRKFTTQGPRKGINHTHEVTVTWQDGRDTESRVKWYGQETRSEYRLTTFGKHFPFLTGATVGSLLVLIPVSLQRFNAFVLDSDEDVEYVRAGLGVEFIGTWGVFGGAEPAPQDADACVDTRFTAFAEGLREFPTGKLFSQTTWAALEACRAAFARDVADNKLVRAMDTEYRLFRVVERKLCTPRITRPFANVEDFLDTAQSILQRRKARAGRSLENHVERLLVENRIPHELRKEVEGTRPDIIIPSVKAYLDKSFPRNRLFIVGVKTTCKDRWRQVLQEGPAVPHKHILTLQEGISENQLLEMKNSNVTLVVPQVLHEKYPPKNRKDLMSVVRFVEAARASVV